MADSTDPEYGTFEAERGARPEHPFNRLFAQPSTILIGASMVIMLMVLISLPRQAPTTGSNLEVSRLEDNGEASGGEAENATAPENVVWRYGVMMDLGSDGSRIFVYRWQPFYPLRSIVQLGSISTQPGVSFYAMHQAGLAGVAGRVEMSLLSLLDFARSLVPPVLRPQTSIHAKCTAGCRLLNGDQLSETFVGIRKALASSGFQFEPDWAQPISGEEEALLDWISINGALGLLHQPVLEGNTVTFSPTVGVMDIGGASAQIAYSVMPVVTAFEQPAALRLFPTPFVTTFRPIVFSYGRGIYHMRLVNGVEHTVYAISRLHYGMNEASKQVLSHDVDRSEKPAPAMGYAHPCVLREIYTTTYGGRIVRGEGNAKECHERVKMFFEQAEKRDLGNISWAQPAPPMKRSYMPFVGMNNFARLHELATLAVRFSQESKKQFFDEVGHKSTADFVTPDLSKENADTEHLKTKGHAQHKSETKKLANQALHGGTEPFTVKSLMECMETFIPSTPSIYLEAAEVVCPMRWPEVQLRFQSSMTVDRLRYACFGLIYMDVLLHHVYTFAQHESFYAMKSTNRCPNLRLPDVDKQFPGYNAKREAKLHSNIHASYDSTWALGGMILEMEEREVAGVGYSLMAEPGQPMMVENGRK